MAKPLRDLLYGKTQVDQQSHMAVAQVVYPDPRKAGPVCGPVEFSQQGMFGAVKYPLLIFDRADLYIFTQLIVERFRDGDFAYAPGCLRREELFLSLYLRVVFVDVKELIIDICRCQRQKFRLPDAAVKQDAESEPVHPHVLILDELVKLVFRPYLHFLSVALPDRAGGLARVYPEPIEFYCIVHDGTELGMDLIHIGLTVRFSVFIPVRAAHFASA